MSTAQKELFKQVKKYVTNRSLEKDGTSLDLPPMLPARDRKFVTELAEDLHLQCNNIMGRDGERHLRLDFPEKLEADEDDEDDEDEEAQLALLRVIKRYDNARVVDVSAEESQEKMHQKYEEKFLGWKNKYYKGKFEWGLESEDKLQELSENYVQGLQWVLFYYYRGVASWSWFYGYHYSPMISGKLQDMIRCLTANNVQMFEKGWRQTLTFNSASLSSHTSSSWGFCPIEAKALFLRRTTI